MYEHEHKIENEKYPYAMEAEAEITGRHASNICFLNFLEIKISSNFPGLNFMIYT